MLNVPELIALALMFVRFEPFPENVLAVTVPTTSNLDVGVVEPMPTFVPDVIVTVGVYVFRLNAPGK